MRCGFGGGGDVLGSAVAILDVRGKIHVDSRYCRWEDSGAGS